MDDEDNDKKRKAAAALAVAAAAQSLVSQRKLNLQIFTLAALGVEKEMYKRNHAQGRFKQSGALHKPEKSFWHRIKKNGDELEFLHFTAFTREAFGELVTIVAPFILSHSLEERNKTPPQKKHLKKTPLLTL